MYNNAPPNTALFTPTAVPPNPTYVPGSGSIQDDVDHESGWFYMNAWDNRGKLIRQGSGSNATELCLGNLSLALYELGSLNAADYAGAAGALSLLPTAGALIGSPTKELWVVYKLMPLAGILSMFLSLGETMVPTQTGAYDPKVTFANGGMMATTDALAEKRRQKDLDHTFRIGNPRICLRRSHGAFAHSLRRRLGPGHRHVDCKPDEQDLGSCPAHSCSRPQ